MNLWFQPSCSVVSLKDRLMQALHYIESRRDSEFLAQIWVPTTIGDRQVLTTLGQPFSSVQSCDRLTNYRSVSKRFQFSADECPSSPLGLPGRVFVGKVPEWTPDVRYFNEFEYPRVNHAQNLDVRGSVALPVFEKSSRSCLGVVELVMTNQKINYNSEIDNICNALEAVELRSSEVLSTPNGKVGDNSYQVILPEIQMVLRAVCDTHKLPLAQTWIPCIQQAKRGSRHSDELYANCVSTVDDACHIRDPSTLGFHQACSEHHLFRGEGVVGRAFRTNEPCFESDITALSKVQYPLSHYAKLFNLKAAVAIRLRSVRTRIVDFVLEFFLPQNCISSGEQATVLNSLSITLQQVCQTLRVVTDKELEDERLFKANDKSLPDIFSAKVMHDNFEGLRHDKDIPIRTSLGASEEASSWITSIMEAQNKGARTDVPASVALQFTKQENERFGVSSGWDPSRVLVPRDSILSGFKQHEEYELKDSGGHKISNTSDLCFSNSERAAAEKRRTKTEKTVSLQDLRKHFAGGLKEAAKNLGVCPTTLKRICRQHGITRWPSRKIKKVGHSLKKLQMVIDSVHGPEGTVQLSSLYENFTKTVWSEKDLQMQGDISFSKVNRNGHLESSKANQIQEGKFSARTSGSSSRSSSSCSPGSTSSPGCSGVLKQQHSTVPRLAVKQESSGEESQSTIPARALDHADMLMLTEERSVTVARSQSHRFNGEHHPAENLPWPILQKDKIDSLKIKATYGDEKCIFRLQPTWGIQNLKEEIIRRFDIAQQTLVDLKYLDDESEWILLTCDADLQECIDVYRSSSARTIRISVLPAAQPFTQTNFVHTGLS